MRRRLFDRLAYDAVLAVVGLLLAFCLFGIFYEGLGMLGLRP